MKLKKLLVVLSALCMMMTMSINATGSDSIVTSAVSGTESSETAYSGSCGDNAVWEFNPENGTLTISGTGDMKNFLFNAPWKTYSADITSLVIEEGITTIGSYSFRYLENITDVVIPEGVTAIYAQAFDDCKKLTSVSLPSTLTIIGDLAFYNCQLLESIIIPENVTKIGEAAFQYCYKLSSVSLPSSLVTIENQVFRNCESLEDIFIPENVSAIGERVFYECKKMKNIEVAQENNYFKDVDGILFSGDMTNLIDFPAGKKLENYTVPNSVETILEAAFKGNRYIKSIILTDNLRSIEKYTFSDCTNLTEVTIYDGLEFIGYEAFNNCRNLITVEVPLSIRYIDEYAFTGTKFYSNLESESEDFIILNHILLKVISSDSKVIVPSDVISISQNAFSNLSNLTEVVIPDGCHIYENIFSKCNNINSIIAGDNCIFDDEVLCISSLVSFKAGNNCIFGNAVFDGCSSLITFTADNNCTLGNNMFTKCSELSECTINGTVNVNGNPFRGISGDMILEYERPALDYVYADNTENKSNKASSDIQNFDDINIESTFSSSAGYNNGYWGIDDVQEITENSTGKIYAAVKHDNGVVFVPYNADKEIMNFSKDDFKFGSAVFDDKDNIYIMWAKSISDANIEKALEEEYANVVVEKYDKSGNFITEYEFPVNLMRTQFPYDAGNAHLGWKNNVLLVYFHTEWTKSSNDGLHHQGSVAAAVNTETSEIIYADDWQGSHSFGSCMIPTDYGYAAIQMGDATARGINFNSYCLKSPEEFKDDYLSSNGYTLLYHSSGQYGTNEHHLDGNTTYTHMGGLAKSNTTYAIAGKSERVYTSDIYKSFDLRTGNYDVFVKLVDQTLVSNVSGLAGESRTDEATGEIADRNVVWLTECNETEKAGQVKIVTLEDGSYCVLWEKFVNDNFDSIRYVIMDECGNIIRHETEICNAKLSDTSVQPIIEGDTLKWAIGNENDNSLIWYTVNLNEFMNSNELYKPLEELAEKNNLSLVLEEGCYGNSNSICWAYLKESGILLITGTGDMNLLGTPWTQYADSITDIIIDGNITSIIDSAFKNFKCVSNVIMPDSIKIIGDSAFSHCEKLVSVDMPASLTELGKSAFIGCTSLKSIHIPENVSSINYQAFYDCSALEDVILPDKLEIIDSVAFAGCERIKSLNIPENVYSIGDNAFSRCYGLKEITINENMKNIKARAFYNCRRLKSITIKSSDVVIGKEAFGYCYYDNGESKKYSDFVIYGNNDSTAQKYAQENDINFIEIDLAITTTTTEITTSTTTTESTTMETTTEPVTTAPVDTTDTITISATTEQTTISTTTTESTTTTTETTATTTTTTTIITTTEPVITTPVDQIKRKLGDINGDNMIDAVDSSFILQEYALLSTRGSGDFTDIQKSVADINGDGMTDAVDASLVLQYYAYVSTGGKESLEEFFGKNNRS